MKRASACGLLLLTLSGCASYFTRKDCEKTNWYQHGYDVAMSGKRLDADDKIKECRKVEAKMSYSEMDTGFKAGMAKYCTAENVFGVGKAGHPFSYDMCDGESEKKMRGQYEKGLVEFCTPGSGYRFGASGGVYENVCHKNTEEAFLTEYRKGRKVYLGAAIQEKERQVSQLNSEIARLENQRNSLTYQQASYARATTTQRTQVYDPNTGTYRQTVSQVPDADAKARSDELQSQISSVNYEIQQTHKKQDDLSAELSKMRTEMVSL